MEKQPAWICGVGVECMLILVMECWMHTWWSPVSTPSRWRRSHKAEWNHSYLFGASTLQDEVKHGLRNLSRVIQCWKYIFVRMLKLVKPIRICSRFTGIAGNSTHPIKREFPAPPWHISNGGIRRWSSLENREPSPWQWKHILFCSSNR